MCCVCSHARMASSTSSVWALPSPLSFMNLQWLLSSYAGFLLSSSCLCVYRCSSLVIPLACSFILSFILWGTVSTWEHPWYSSRLFSGSLAEATGFFFHSITALLPMRSQLILFLSILILALYSFILREVTKRVPFWFRPCVDCLRPWTMIFPWIFLFLYRQVFAYGQ